MDFIKKHFLSVTVLLGIFVLYLISRLYNIMSLPIFTDEAIYVRWSQIAHFDANWRFISLTDGKQPSFVWFAMILMEFIPNPLAAGRMVSVIAGLFSILGLFFLTNELFKNKKIAFLASLTYVIFPFALVYDRMALYDSLTAMFMIWSLYFEVLLVRKIRLDLAMILGIVIGWSVLTKTSGFFALYLLPFAFVLFDFKQKDAKKKFLFLVIYFLVAVVIANAMYLILRLSGYYHIISDKNSVFVYSVSEWLGHHPADMYKDFISNMKGLTDWFLTYMTYPFLALIVGSLFIGYKFIREKFLLVIWFAAPFFALAVFGKLVYPRYLLFMTLPLLPLVAFTLTFLIERFRKSIVMVGLVLLAAYSVSIYTDYFIITDFARAPIAKADLGQYINDWPAGGGVKEAVKFFQQKAAEGPIYIGTAGTFGLLPHALEIYFMHNPNVKIDGYWPIGPGVPPEAVLASKTKQTYFVFYQPCPSCPSTGEAPKTWDMEKVFSVRKGIGNAYLTVYQVK